MQLKEVMEKTKLTKKAIRYYESRDLIEVKKKENGYRDYSEKNIDRLLEIKKLRNLDFSIKEIQMFFESDQKKRETLTKKFTEMDYELSTLSTKKELISNLIKGDNLRDITIDEHIRTKKKPYLFIPNFSLYFGWVNLILFILTFIYFLAFEPFALMNGWIIFSLHVLASTFLLYVSDKRRKIKQLGIETKEKKLWELALQILAFGFLYSANAMFINNLITELILSSTYHDLFNKIGSVIMILLFFSLSIVVVILSFIDPDLTFTDLEIKYFNS